MGGGKDESKVGTDLSEERSKAERSKNSKPKMN